MNKHPLKLKNNKTSFPSELVLFNIRTLVKFFVEVQLESPLKKAKGCTVNFIQNDLSSQNSFLRNSLSNTPTMQFGKDF